MDAPNHNCKIDSHEPTEDGLSCSCGYFTKRAPAPKGATADEVLALRRVFYHRLSTERVDDVICRDDPDLYWSVSAMLGGPDGAVKDSLTVVPREAPAPGGVEARVAKAAIEFVAAQRALIEAGDPIPQREMSDEEMQNRAEADAAAWTNLCAAVDGWTPDAPAQGSLQEGESLDLEAERKAFEAWASDDGEFPKFVERRIDGIYRIPAVDRSWIVWRARASLGRPA